LVNRKDKSERGGRPKDRPKREIVEEEWQEKIWHFVQ
jgi:hypothetical protein